MKTSDDINLSILDLMPKDDYSKNILSKRALDLSIKKDEQLDNKNDVIYVQVSLENGGNYGIEHASINEILVKANITAVPFSPDFIDGVINWRGLLISIINLKKLFKIDSMSINTNGQNIIIVNSEKTTIGILVDNIEGIEKYDPTKIDPPLASSTIESKYISGLSKGFIAILNVKEIINNMLKN